MSDSAQSKIAFLSSVYHLLFDMPGGELYYVGMYTYLPRELLDSDRTHKTVKDLIQDLIATNTLDEAFTRAISQLHIDWPQIRAAIREMIRDLIRQHRFCPFFEDYMMRESAEELRDKSVRWDIATIVFDARKQKVFSVLKLRDVDLANQGAPQFYNYPTVEGCANELLPLLQMIRDCDVAALQLSVPEHILHYRKQVLGRCNDFYVDTLVALETMVHKAAEARYGEAYDKRRTGRELDLYLVTFKQKAEEIVKSQSMSVVTDGILEEVRSLMAQHQKPIKQNVYPEAYNMTKYKYENNGPGQQNNFSGNARVGSLSQFSGTTAPIEFHLSEVTPQLSDLKAKANQTARTDEEFRETADLMDAEELAKKGDRDGMLEKLKGVGKWTFDLAKEIGADVVANIISGSV